MLAGPGSDRRSLIISIVQVVTSIHDLAALAFVPRIVVTFVVFLIVFPWMMNTMMSYTEKPIGVVYDLREMTKK